MTTSISLGRILGIRIGINWSWVVVFALIAPTLASGIFPDTNPGLRHGTYVLMAIVASVLFFASLLLHELGHTVQARARDSDRDGCDSNRATCSR
jgi:Zn-dependent protease